jgi:hypothetical protein
VLRSPFEVLGVSGCHNPAGAEKTVEFAVIFGIVRRGQPKLVDVRGLYDRVGLKEGLIKTNVADQSNIR